MEEILDPKPHSSLSISNRLKNTLMNLTYWSRFISLVGLVIIGLFIVMLVVGGALTGMAFNLAFLGLNTAAGAIGIIIYVVILLIVMYIIWLLYAFSTKVRRAIASNNQAEFEEGFNQLRRFFKIFGVFLMIYVVLSIIAIITVTSLNLSAFF